MNSLQSGAACIGRILLSLIFVMSGVHKLTAWQTTVDQMSSEGIVLPDALLPAAVLLELGGGLALLLGYRARFAAAALIVFLVPTTLIFHDFWEYSGPEQQQQMIEFVKNTAILGGLFVVLGAGAGCCSFDAKRHSAPAGR